MSGRRRNEMCSAHIISATVQNRQAIFAQKFAFEPLFENTGTDVSTSCSRY
jgi:hypothetical protein